MASAQGKQAEPTTSGMCSWQLIQEQNNAFAAFMPLLSTLLQVHGNGMLARTMSSWIDCLSSLTCSCRAGIIWCNLQTVVVAPISLARSNWRSLLHGQYYCRQMPALCAQLPCIMPVLLSRVPCKHLLGSSCTLQDGRWRRGHDTEQCHDQVIQVSLPKTTRKLPDQPLLLVLLIYSSRCPGSTVVWSCLQSTRTSNDVLMEAVQSKRSV